MVKMGDDLLWLKWVRALSALSQTGLHFSRDPFDAERYRAVRGIAAEMLSQYSTLDKTESLDILAHDAGYATPKVDVRAVVFREGRILLVSERADGGRWTLPGGWADVNETPSQAVVREVEEESGFITRAEKLLAVYDRDVQGHRPAFPHTVYKLFFRCVILGGEARENMEIGGIGFFPRNDLPQLSTSRVNAAQIHHFFDHLDHPHWPTDFD